MWTHPAWPGRSLSRVRGRNALASYAAALPAVEGNTTFYGLPTPENAQRWAESTPDDFRFMFKLPRTITHQRKLRNTEELVAEFFDVLEPCLSRMSPVLVQLPSAFGPESLDVLESFLREAPDVVRYAVEVRHPSFFEDRDRERRLNDLLFSVGVDRVMFDARAVFAGPCITAAEREAFSNKPNLPVRAVSTADSPVVRFIGQSAPEANPPFWQPWVGTVSRWLAEGKSPTVFIHTPDNSDAVDLARKFHEEVRAVAEGVEPLAPSPREVAQKLF